MNKENRFEWKDYDDRSSLYCGDKYIATVDYNEAINRGFMLSLSIDHAHYFNHDLNVANLDEAKQKAIEIIASEYERVIGQARAKLKEYEALALGLSQIQKVKVFLNFDDEQQLQGEYSSIGEALTHALSEPLAPLHDAELPHAFAIKFDGRAVYFEDYSGYYEFDEASPDEKAEIENVKSGKYQPGRSEGLRSLDDTIDDAKKQGAADPGIHKNITKEVSLEETR